jgi:hypothetical protein
VVEHNFSACKLEWKWNKSPEYNRLSVYVVKHNFSACKLLIAYKKKPSEYNHLPVYVVEHNFSTRKLLIAYRKKMKQATRIRSSFGMVVETISVQTTCKIIIYNNMARIHNHVTYISLTHLFYLVIELSQEGTNRLSFIKKVINIFKYCIIILKYDKNWTKKKKPLHFVSTDHIKYYIFSAFYTLYTYLPYPYLIN